MEKWKRPPPEAAMAWWRNDIWTETAHAHTLGMGDVHIRFGQTVRTPRRTRGVFGRAWCRARG